jgi:hypothetical protein
LPTSDRRCGRVERPKSGIALKGCAQATTAAIKAKPEKHAAYRFGLPKDEMRKFDVPKIEVPVAFRELAEKAVAQV